MMGAAVGSFSIWHWLVIFVFGLLFLYPNIRILRRAGFSGWWVLLIFVPIVGFLTPWIFAFVRWPAVDKQQA